MNIGLKIIPALMMMCLTACSGIKVSVDTDCMWFEDQSFSDETKLWLREKQPWPDYVRSDFDKVADNNDLAKKYCE